MKTSLLRQPSRDYCSPSGCAVITSRPHLQKYSLIAHTLRGAACTRPLREKSVHTKGKGASLRAQQTQTEVSRVEQTEDIYHVSLRTREARKSIRFAQSRDGRIVIEAVAIGSEAEQEGIRPGQQLLSISDPIRNDESWNISLQTKLSRVRDALQYRSPPTIYLQLTQSSIEDEAGFEWRSEKASESVDNSSSSQDLLNSITGGEAGADLDDDEDRQTVSGQLQEQQRAWQAKASAEEAKYKARVQQRRDYMERESGRNDGPFFALLFSFFVLPAAVILVVAWKTGYLASLDSGQHF